MQPPIGISPRRAAALGVAALALAGCGSGSAGIKPSPKPDAMAPARPACASRDGFELSLVRARGGRRTPTLAAVWFAEHGGIPGTPRSGWRLARETRRTAILFSHRTVLEAVRGSDGTWQVDGGYTCTSR
jgi:hypothetical protein